MDEKAIHVTSWGAEVAPSQLCVCVCDIVCVYGVCVCVCKDGAIDVK